MKKLLRTFAIALSGAGAIVLASCNSGEGDDQQNNLTVTPETLTFEADATEAQEVQIKSMSAWVAETTGDWIIVSPNFGETDATVSVTVKAGDEARSGSITIRNSVSSKTIAVNQLQIVEASLELTPPDDIEFYAEGGSETVTVTTNKAVWDVESDQEWCVVTKGNGGFTVAAEPNNTDKPMPTATVTVTAGTGENIITQTIRVTQEGIAVQYFNVANLFYYEVRSLPEAGLGYYRLELPFDIVQGEHQLMNVAFYHDIVAGKAEHTKFPKGTFTINPALADPASVPAKFDASPGTGTLTTAVNGSYRMHVMMAEPHQLLLMKSGTMTIGGEGNAISITINFMAENPETNQTMVYKGSYSYNGTGAFPPLFTYVQAGDEEYNATMTEVVSATLGDTGNNSKYASVKFTDDTGLQELKFFAFVPEGATRLADGTYTFAADEKSTEPMTIRPGFYSPQEGARDTFYVAWENGGQTIGVSMPATSGSMTVTSDGDDYNIEFNFKGVNERVLRKKATFTGTYHGPIVFE
jgi:hypothetical protein